MKRIWKFIVGLFRGRKKAQGGEGVDLLRRQIRYQDRLEKALRAEDYFRR